VELKAAAVVIGPKIDASSVIEIFADEIKAGEATKILNCANPPGGAVSVDTCRVIVGAAAKTIGVKSERARAIRMREF
jgi:hypothetical protein